MIDLDLYEVLKERIGCTYRGGHELCGSREIWMAISGKDGTPAEGKVALLCDEHTKLMASADLTPAQFARGIEYVEVVDLGAGSLN